MEQDDRLVLSSSFGAAAVAYAEHRPDYAQAAVHWALEPAPGPRVLDLGAGTGKLTATLVAWAADVVAVEPDPAMRTELRRALPEVHALPGSAEAIPLPDGSVDAVLAGNAMHWFKMAVAGPEIARVLAPGGILAGLWNVLDDRVDWVSGLARVSGSAAIGPRDMLSSWRAATANMHLPNGGLVARFGLPEQAEFPHGQRRAADSLLATLKTRAGMLVMPEQERQATLGRIHAFLASRPETGRGEFILPMLTPTGGREADMSVATDGCDGTGADQSSLLMASVPEQVPVALSEVCPADRRGDGSDYRSRSARSSDAPGKGLAEPVNPIK